MSPHATVKTANTYRYLYICMYDLTFIMFVLELEAVVKEKLLINDLQKLLHVGQTSSMEVAYSFSPKAVPFFFTQMQAR